MTKLKSSYDKFISEMEQARAEEDQAKENYIESSGIGNILSTPRAATQSEIMLGIKPKSYEGIKEGFTTPAKIRADVASDKYKDVLQRYKMLSDEESKEATQKYREDTLGLREKSMQATAANRAATAANTDTLKFSQQADIVQKGIARVKQSADRFKNVEQGFNKIKEIATSQPTGLGDITMVYNFIKLLDPNSAVKGDEVKLVRTGVPALEKMANLYNQYAKGSVLPASQIPVFVSLAKQAYQSELDGYNQVVNQEKDLQQSFGLSPEIVGKGLYQPMSLQGKSTKDLNDDELAKKYVEMKKQKESLAQGGK